MKVAVTGAGGFVGRAVLARLGAAEVPAIAISRAPSANAHVETRRLPAPDAPEPEFASALTGVTHIVHAAGLTNAAPDTPESAYFAANAELTARLASAARSVGVQRFMVLSSIRAIVGATFDGTITRATLPAPTDAYGCSKLAAEKAAEAAFADQSERLTILRLAPVYGVGMGGNLGRLLRLSDSGLPLPFGSFSAARTLVAVEAVGDLIYAALVSPRPLQRRYLVGDRQPATLPNIITAFRQGLDRPRRLLRVPPTLLSAIAGAAGKRETFRALSVSQVCDTSALAADGLPQRAESVTGLQRVARLSGAERRS
jgi:UDP-glucose 4-epimerase